MKKLLSMMLSAAIGLTALTSVSGGAFNEKAAAAEKGGMVVFGDSIAAGVTRKGDVEHNYGEICGDYLGCKVSNYAVSGDNTSDLLKVIDKLSDEQKKNVANAEYIVISIGGNDIMQYVSKELINYAVTKDFLNDGYTKDNIPANPSVSDMIKVVKFKGEGSLAEYASSGLRQGSEVIGVIGNIEKNLCVNDSDNEGYLENVTIANVKTVVSKLKAISPDSKIMIQNIYQPVEMEQTYLESTYGKNSSQESLINSLVTPKLEKVMSTYDQQLRTIDGIEVVDVKTLFTSSDKALNASNPGHANYFVDIQTGSLSTADVHPNQKGHVAIATAILEKINKLHDDNGLLRKTFNSFSDKDKYPAIALATYNKVAGTDPTLTTTTTSTTTTTTTTTTITTTQKPTTTTTTTKATTTTKKITTTSTTAATAPVTTTAQPVKTIALGDVDDNKTINAVDASYVLEDYARTSTNKASKFSDAQKKAADVDKDTKINAVDASYILSYYAYTAVTSKDVKSFEEYLKTA